MFRIQNGKNVEDYDRLREQRMIEMENRRREMVKRSENKQRLRGMHIKRKETQETEKMSRLKEGTDLKIRFADRTHRLAEELARRKHIELQEFIKQKQSKYKTESLSNCTLNNLEKILMEEKKRDEVECSKTIGKLWYHKEDSTKKQEHEKKLKYKKELQQQLIDNRRRLHEKEEEKHRERKIMEEAEGALRRENLEAQKRKQDIALLLQNERDAFLKARQFWKDKRREVLRREHNEISKLIAEKEILRKKATEKQTDTHSSRDAIAKSLAKRIEEEDQRKLEREEICRELYLAEKESELAIEEMKQALKKKSTAKELLQDMVRYQKSVAEKNAKENAIDAAFARYLLEERIAMEEKGKREEAVRREKAIQYGIELREVIARNRMQSSRSVLEKQSDSNANSEQKNISDNTMGPKAQCFSDTVLQHLQQ